MNDVFRQKPKVLNEQQKSALHQIKRQADILLDMIEEYGNDPRSTALAKTKLQEAVFWASYSVSE